MPSRIVSSSEELPLFRCLLLRPGILPSLVRRYACQLLPLFRHTRLPNLRAALLAALFPHFAHHERDNIFFHVNSLQSLASGGIRFSSCMPKAALASENYARSVSC